MLCHKIFANNDFNYYYGLLFVAENRITSDVDETMVVGYFEYGKMNPCVAPLLFFTRVFFAL